MSLPLPTLDDRSFADLVEQARALIPGYAPDWTDHNPSDPGITLIELFAWLAEMLIYRTDRVPDSHKRVFLKLLNGSDWPPGPDLAEDIRSSVVALRQIYRAVTREDYETLAGAVSDGIARAKCVPRRYLGADTEAGRGADRPGHISVIIVPRSQDEAPQPSDELRQSVWNDLEPRRILTTRHHVVGPVYAPASAEILVACRADARPNQLRDQVAETLQNFLHPLTGGQDGQGWPFGRAVYVSELYQLLEGIPGVDYVPDIALSSACPADAVHCVAAAELWHEDGEPIGLGLSAHHLPWARIEPGKIVVASAFVQAQVEIRLQSASSAAPADVRRKVKTVIKRLFHPLHGGPNGTSERTIGKQSLNDAVLALPEIDTISAITLSSDPAHGLLDELGAVVGIHFSAQELADVRVGVELT